MSLLLPEEAAHRLGHLSLVRSSSSSSQHDAIVAVGGEEEALADEVGGVAGANTTEGGGGGLFFVMDGDSGVYDQESSSSIWHLVWTITLVRIKNDIPITLLQKLFSPSPPGLFPSAADRDLHRWQRPRVHRHRHGPAPAQAVQPVSG